jgi:hypothetical protein
VSAVLGVYHDRGQLDHDVRMLLDQLVSELVADGVDFAVAAAALRRIVREGRR